MNKVQKGITHSELTIRGLLEKHTPGIDNIKMMTSNRFSSFDAYTDDYILEFKTRFKRYDSTQMEKIKFDKNLDVAKRHGKKFLYVVKDPTGLYVFSISKLVEDGYDFKWITMSCPKTTSFKDKTYIDKVVHNIPFSKCQWSMEM